LASPPRLILHVRGPTQHADTVGDERLLHDGGCIGILVAEDPWHQFQQRDFAAEARERLGELAPDRARADHGQTPRQRGQAEHRFVGQVAGLGQARDGRRARARAGGNAGAGEAQRLPAHRHGVGAGETAFAQEHVNAEAAEAGRRVVRADAGTQLAHARHHGRKIDRDARGHAHAERTRPPDVGRGARSPEEGLRRHAADVQAVAAEQVALDERHPGAQARGARGRHEARRAAADHDEIVAALGRRVGPVRWVRVFEPLAIHRIEGLGLRQPCGVPVADRVAWSTHRVSISLRF
jgi:hypothetical protein